MQELIGNDVSYPWPRRGRGRGRWNARDRLLRRSMSSSITLSRILGRRYAPHTRAHTCVRKRSRRPIPRESRSTVSRRSLASSVPFPTVARSSPFFHSRIVAWLATSSANPAETRAIEFLFLFLIVGRTNHPLNLEKREGLRNWLAFGAIKKERNKRNVVINGR